MSEEVAKLENFITNQFNPHLWGIPFRTKTIFSGTLHTSVGSGFNRSSFSGIAIALYAEGVLPFPFLKRGFSRIMNSVRKLIGQTSPLWWGLWRRVLLFCAGALRSCFPINLASLNVIWVELYYAGRKGCNPIKYSNKDNTLRKEGEVQWRFGWSGRK